MHWQQLENGKTTQINYQVRLSFILFKTEKGAHHLNNEHTVFGEVISGWETIDKISKLETDVKEWPLVDVNMKVEIIN